MLTLQFEHSEGGSSTYVHLSYAIHVNVSESPVYKFPGFCGWQEIVPATRYTVRLPKQEEESRDLEAEGAPKWSTYNSTLASYPDSLGTRLILHEYINTPASFPGPCTAFVAFGESLGTRLLVHCSSLI